jgi:DnaJ-class molecular chaperone
VGEIMRFFKLTENKIDCDRCEGYGSLDLNGEIECDECEGTGKVFECVPVKTNGE